MSFFLIKIFQRCVTYHRVQNFLKQCSHFLYVLLIYTCLKDFFLFNKLFCLSVMRVLMIPQRQIQSLHFHMLTFTNILDFHCPITYALCLMSLSLVAHNAHTSCIHHFFVFILFMETDKKLLCLGSLPSQSQCLCKGRDVPKPRAGNAVQLSSKGERLPTARVSVAASQGLSLQEAGNSRKPRALMWEAGVPKSELLG